MKRGINSMVGESGQEASTGLALSGKGWRSPGDNQEVLAEAYAEEEVRNNNSWWFAPTVAAGAQTVPAEVDVITAYSGGWRW